MMHTTPKYPSAARSLVLFFWVFFSLAPVAAEPDERFDRMDRLAGVYRSNLALTQLQLLARKSGERQPLVDPSDYNLESDLYGGFGGGAQFGGSLDLITGRRAIDESLQLDSIGFDEGNESERTISIERLTPLEVRSHPWQEMLAELDRSPRTEIFSLAPHDHFVAYFRKGKVMQQLEDIGRELSLPLDQLFEVHRNLSIRRTAARRLGLEEEMKWEHMMGETLFVAEDLDFYPATHFAIIFNAPGAELVLDAPITGRIGPYYVVATSQLLYDRIAACHQKTRTSMADSLDFHYSWAVLDQRRDGMMYLSEAFILRLVGPAYRLNAARRRTALRGLAKRQYEALAYRCLTGAWPQSFEQMQEEGYLESTDSNPFVIGPEGEVSHRVWGTLAAPKPLSEVPITGVTADEKNRYDEFREGYQRFWRQFFDPVGVAFAIGDRLYVHTIILPLIDNSEYRSLQAVTGGKPSESRYLNAQLLVNEPVMLVSRFDFDGLLSLFRPRSERAARQHEMNSLARERTGDAELDFYTCVGDEVGLAFGRNFSKSLDDVYAWLHVRNRDAFHRVLGAGMGAEEKTGEHTGIPYYRNGWFTFFYHGDYLFVTGDHDATLQRLCQAAADGSLPQPKQAPNQSQSKSGTKKVELTAKQRRTLDYIGAEQNILFQAELHRFPAFAESLLQAGNSWQGRRQIVGQMGYLVDVHLAREAGIEAERFFRCIPERVYGVPVVASAGGVQLAGLSLEDVKFDEFDQLLGDEVKTKLRQSLDRLRSLGIGLRFTPEGLSTKVAITNPLQEEEDPRFGEQSVLPSAGNAASIPPYRLMLALGVLLVFVVALTRGQRRSVS